MKRRVLDLLVCPDCKGILELRVFGEIRGLDDTEIESGLLTCSRGEWYPVIKGVPRMLKPELRDSLFEEYRDFFDRYRAALPAAASTSGRTGHRYPGNKKKRQAMSCFGYEWTEFSGYENENFRSWLAGSPEDSFFSGKLGLEIGCGAGRHTETAAKLGSEIFAVDLSKAVDVTYRKNAGSGKAHIIQADIYALPFRSESFDFSYCLGVIQHLPDPPKGFLALSSYVRPGGSLFVNVYAKGRISWPVLRAMRFFTTRFPSRLTRSIAFVMTLLDWVFIGPYKILSRIDAMRPVVNALACERIKAYAKLNFHANLTDWFDRLAAPIDMRYGKEDVRGWYEDAGFRDIVVAPLRNAFWNGAGRKT